MAIVKEYNEKRIYYTSAPVEIGFLERKWLDDLKLDVLRNNTHPINLIINLTWFNVGEMDSAKLITWIAESGPKEQIKVWFVGTVDGTDWFKTNPVYNYIKETYCVNFAGFGEDHWNSWIPKWFVDNNKDIEANDLQLNTNPKYTYLCYNRKPRPNRVRLVQALVDNDLIHKGWVTFEQGCFPEVDKLSGETDQTLHSSDLRFTRPEDLTSLGELSIWRDSYAIIVSETEPNDAWQLSEKTWKPIFGMRPFLLNANPGVYNVLAKLNLYTPRDLFKNNELDGEVPGLIKQVLLLSSMSPEELYELWISQHEMLAYNRTRILEIASVEPERILNWSQSYSVPVTACGIPSSVTLNGAAVPAAVI